MSVEFLAVADRLYSFLSADIAHDLVSLNSLLIIPCTANDDDDDDEDSKDY